MNNEPKLYEVTVIAYKSFFIEADNEDDALCSEALEDETDPSFRCGNKFDWEHDSTDIKEVDPKQAERIRAQRPEQIISYKESER